jgi:predicted GNAT family acetyltransferase
MDIEPTASATPNTEFRNAEHASRYEMAIDGTLVCILDYRVNGSRVSFPRTFTLPQFRGNGYAAQLVEWAVDDVAAHADRRIVPMCWYVGDWFDKHPERAGLLAG